MSFTPEFKAEIVERCLAGDRSIGQVARDFDLVESAVRRWVELDVVGRSWAHHEQGYGAGAGGLALMSRPISRPARAVQRYSDVGIPDVEVTELGVLRQLPASCSTSNRNVCRVGVNRSCGSPPTSVVIHAGQSSRHQSSAGTHLPPTRC